MRDAHTSLPEKCLIGQRGDRHRHLSATFWGYVPVSRIYDPAGESAARLVVLYVDRCSSRSCERLATWCGELEVQVSMVFGAKDVSKDPVTHTCKSYLHIWSIICVMDLPGHAIGRLKATQLQRQISYYIQGACFLSQPSPSSPGWIEKRHKIDIPTINIAIQRVPEKGMVPFSSRQCIFTHPIFFI